MTKNFSLYCAVHSYRAGQSGYSEPLGRDQACVYEDGTRYVYSFPPTATRTDFWQSIMGFGKWVRNTFAKPERRVTGRFPVYHVE